MKISQKVGSGGLGWSRRWFASMKEPKMHPVGGLALWGGWSGFAALHEASCVTSEISPSHGRESRFETKLSGVLLAISGLCGLPARRYAAALAAREREREREGARERQRESSSFSPLRRTITCYYVPIIFYGIFWYTVASYNILSNTIVDDHAP